MTQNEQDFLKRAKRVGNVATGDHVRFMHQGIPVQGRGTISQSSGTTPEPTGPGHPPQRA